LVKDADGKKQRIGFREAVGRILKDDGVVGFWRGILPALVLVSNPMIQYTAFEKLKAFWEKTRRLTGFDFFFLGASMH
jgi:adenine nucleotide transporter 17